MKNNLSNSKVIRFIVKNSILVSIIYILFILFITYIINRFKFENNSSIIFIILLLIGPIIIYIISKVVYRENKNKLLLKSIKFLDLVKSDIDTGKFNNEFINKLKEYTDVYFNNSNNIYYLYLGKSSNLIIRIEKKETIIYIKNTKIEYHLYYNKGYNKTIFDYDNIMSYSTDYYYKKVIDIISKLINCDLVYLEYLYKKKVIGYKLMNEYMILYERYNINLSNIKYKIKEFKIKIK